MQCQANTFLTLHTAPFTLYTCTSHPTLHLISNHVSSSHLISALLISSHLLLESSKKVLLNCFHLLRALINLSHPLEVVLNSSQLFCTPESSYCQREVSCTKKTIGRRFFWYIEKFETQMHLHRKAFPKYFVLQSLHKILPSTTLYYKACTKHAPVLLCTRKACAQHFSVLLCTTKLAQSTSHYFLLQSLHKVRSSTTL